jgi:hypothetical protein
VPIPRPTPLPVALPVALAFAMVATGGAFPGRAVAQDAPPAAADSTGAERRGSLVGLSVGVPRYEGETVPELFTVGVQWTQLRPGRPGFDFAIGTMPRLLSEGLVVFGARGGVAVPIAPAPGVLLLPSAGVSLLGGVGAGGGAGTSGFNAGLAAAVLPAGGVGLRAGVTWHRFEEAGGGVWLWELGLVRGPRTR